MKDTLSRTLPGRLSGLLNTAVVAGLAVVLYLALRTHSLSWDGTFHIAVLTGRDLSVASNQVFYEAGPISNHLLFTYAALGWVMVWDLFGWKGSVVLPVQILNILLASGAIGAAYLGFGYGGLAGIRRIAGTLALIFSLGYVRLASDTDSIVGALLLTSVAFAFVLKGAFRGEKEAPSAALLVGVGLALAGAVLWHLSAALLVPGFGIMVLGMIADGRRREALKAFGLFLAALALPVAAIFLLAMLSQLETLTAGTALLWLRGPHVGAAGAGYQSLSLDSILAAGHTLIKALLDTHTESLRQAAQSGAWVSPATAGPLAVATFVFGLAARGCVMLVKSPPRPFLVLGGASALLLTLVGVAWFFPLGWKYTVALLPLGLFFALRGLDGWGARGAVVAVIVAGGIFVANWPAWYDATRAPMVEARVACLLDHIRDQDLVIVDSLPEWKKILAVDPDQDSLAWEAVTVSYQRRMLLRIKDTQDPASVVSHRARQALERSGSVRLFMPKSPERREEVRSILEGNVAGLLLFPVKVMCPASAEDVEVWSTVHASTESSPTEVKGAGLTRPP